MAPPQLPMFCGKSAIPFKLSAWMRIINLGASFSDLAHLHRLKYDGPLEVLVTQGDTIYITEAEDRCADLTMNSLDALLKECAARNVGNSLLQPEGPSPSPSLVESDGERENEAAIGASHALSPTSREKMLRILHRPEPVSVASASSSFSAAAPAAASKSERPLSPPSPFFDPLLRPPPSAVLPWACALLVLVPLRLGISSVNQEYHEVKHTLFSHSVRDNEWKPPFRIHVSETFLQLTLCRRSRDSCAVRIVLE